MMSQSAGVSTRSHPETRALLQYLQKNPGLRARIAAPPNKTLLYAGQFFQASYRELEASRRKDPACADKVILADVVQRLEVPGTPYRTLLEWAEHIDGLRPKTDVVFHRLNGLVVWRALSGIFCANARGKVSFHMGSWDEPRTASVSLPKVFPVTELPVLLRNPAVHPLSRDVLHYFQRCLKLRDPTGAETEPYSRQLNFAYIANDI